jgi:hypothetical protein
VEAFRFMQRSKRKQYILYPLLSFFLLAAPLFLLVAAARAQSSTDATPAPQATAPSPAAAPSASPQTAAERVRARRQQRIAAIINDIYGHKYEAYGGYGYLRFTPGPSLQHVTEAAWNVGITDFLKPKLGLTADVRGYYGTAYTYNNEFQVFKPSISQYVYLFGPQYRVTQGQHIGTSVRVLAGYAHGNFDTNTGGLPGTLIGLYPNGNALALNGGIPVDYNISPALSARITPDLLYTRFGSANQLNLGFTASIMYRFGKTGK